MSVEAYKLAAQDALATGRIYVEGYAILPDGTPIEHAWTVDARGVVFDSMKLVGYHGVPLRGFDLMPALQGRALLRDRDVREVVQDGNWNESDHPRAENGQFGSGSGGAKEASAPAGKSGVRSYGSGKPLDDSQYVNKGGSKEQLSAIKEATKLIPEYHRSALKDVKFINADTLGSVMTSAQMKAQGVDPGGAGGAAVQGLTSHDGKTIGIVENFTLPGKLFGLGKTKVKTSGSRESIVLHEVGHAYDKHSKGRMTAMYARGNAKNEAMLKMTNQEAEDASYFLNEPEEMFAELYAAAFAHNTNTFFGGMTRDRVEEVFAKPLAGLRNSSLG